MEFSIIILLLTVKLAMVQYILQVTMYKWLHNEHACYYLVPITSLQIWNLVIKQSRGYLCMVTLN